MFFYCVHYLSFYPVIHHIHHIACSIIVPIHIQLTLSCHVSDHPFHLLYIKEKTLSTTHSFSFSSSLPCFWPSIHSICRKNLSTYHSFSLPISYHVSDHLSFNFYKESVHVSFIFLSFIIPSFWPFLHSFTGIVSHDFTPIFFAEIFISTIYIRLIDWISL